MRVNEGKDCVRITNIQRFSLHDGPGIRTTVFLKGCTLHCPWCANPENIKYQKQDYFDETMCIRRGHTCCIDPNCFILKGNVGPLSVPVIDELLVCRCDALDVFGKDISIDALEYELMKDIAFYKDKGGVTFSGGEPLIQLNQYKELLDKLDNNKIHKAVETALFVDHKIVVESVSYFDLFIVDMKILIPNKCRHVLGGELNLYLKNLSYVVSNVKNLIIRIPAIDGYTLESDNINQLINCLTTFNIRENVQVLYGHSLGYKKNKVLGQKCISVTSRDVNKLEYALLKADIKYTNLSV